ncbi:kinase [Cohnella kolymensis]|uniref:Kinase n=1 Tax=Cohnella kolymensis TaxID=1590652 RepID=A0ABR4ZZV9_9BACL|nr:aminoglycoside phosphotransferase family protein [Cohnella kolymensis]KIL34354.1 kinase [Cohnella kolymensis]
MRLPDKFINTIKGVHQDAGEQWLANFDELIWYCEWKWSLKVMEPFPLSFNFAAPVILQDGRQAVLKLCVPGKEFITEKEALIAYRGSGIAELMDYDSDRGIMLLERLNPGETLKTIHNDEEATRIAAGVMKKLHKPASTSHFGVFPTIQQWSQGLLNLRQRFDGGTGPLPERLVRKAELYFPELISTMKDPHLLHGDLHHENILSAEREPWLAIDPKGLIGEREYEVISFLLNNLPDSDKSRITERRVDIFANELQLRKDRILSWAFCHSILSAWWCVEDNAGSADSSLEMAMIFDNLRSRSVTTNG